MNKTQTWDAMKRIHKEGHLGRRKTLRMFRRRFQGVKENEICRKMIRGCQGCQKGTDYSPRYKISGHINSLKPWDTLCVDIVGPLPRTHKGERFILSVMDCFTRYLILIPMKNHNAETVSRAIYERVIAYFGVPANILSDRGAEFTGRVWAGIMETLGINKKLTSPYYPQGNALVERVHRTVGNMIRSGLIEQAGAEWTTLLPGIMLTLNEMPQEKHGYTATQAMWGKGVKLPVDLIWPKKEKKYREVSE